MKTWLCVGEGGHIHVCTPKCEQAENQEPDKSRDSFWFNCHFQVPCETFGQPKTSMSAVWNPTCESSIEKM